MSVTLTLMVPLADRVRARLHVLVPTVATAALQLLPLSMDTYTPSPLFKLKAKVPLTVWAVVLVVKSVLVVLLAAVSALSATVVTVLVGALVSST